MKSTRIMPGVYLAGTWVVYKTTRGWTGQRIVRCDDDGIWWQRHEVTYPTRQEATAACLAEHQ